MVSDLGWAIINHNIDFKKRKVAVLFTRLSSSFDNNDFCSESLE